jgi:hypothetical protein
MPYKDQQIQDQLDSNSPEVRQGQIWNLGPRDFGILDYPVELRVICRYPFAAPEDGRLWLLENTGAVYSVMRLTEASLRSSYYLSENAPQS